MGDTFNFEWSRTSCFNERTLASRSDTNSLLRQSTIGGQLRIVSIDKRFDTAA
jgi:hypothetical protein